MKAVLFNYQNKIYTLPQRWFLRKLCYYNNNQNSLNQGEVKLLRAEKIGQQRRDKSLKKGITPKAHMFHVDQHSVYMHTVLGS